MADKTLQDLLNAQKETNKKLDKALKDVGKEAVELAKDAADKAEEEARKQEKVVEEQKKRDEKAQEERKKTSKKAVDQVEVFKEAAKDSVKYEEAKKKLAEQRQKIDSVNTLYLNDQQKEALKTAKKQLDEQERFINMQNADNAEASKTRIDQIDVIGEGLTSIVDA
tara:strand:+ start:221 stop:721 length:501 start_codon:yes stop_codon:yes gene_type:complete